MKTSPDWHEPPMLPHGYSEQSWLGRTFDALTARHNLQDLQLRRDFGPPPDIVKVCPPRKRFWF